MGPRLRFAVAALAALLALNAALLVVAPGAAVSTALGDYLFGPRVVRADVVLFDGGTPRLVRIDRGRVLALTGDVLRLTERDGTVATLTIAPDATIRLNGRAVRLQRLRRGMQVQTSRDGDGPVHTIDALR